jgi:hypothetical protein
MAQRESPLIQLDARLPAAAQFSIELDPVIQGHATA